MGIFDFFGKSKDKNKAEKYQRDNDLPEKAEVLGQTLYKRDMSGLQAYFDEMTNMERIFKEFTGAIRNVTILLIFIAWFFNDKIKAR